MHQEALKIVLASLYIIHNLTLLFSLQQKFEIKEKVTISRQAQQKFTLGLLQKLKSRKLYFLQYIAKAARPYWIPISSKAKHLQSMFLE